LVRLSGSGGCTLLIFENHQETWRFNSRITLVNTPIYLGNQRNVAAAPKLSHT